MEFGQNVFFLDITRRLMPPLAKRDSLADASGYG
jgi:hypothetical protein